MASISEGQNNAKKLILLHDQNSKVNETLLPTYNLRRYKIVIALHNLFLLNYTTGYRWNRYLPNWYNVYYD